DTWTTPGSTTALPVSDTPSTAREPSGMVTATTSSGSSISISTASSRRATLRTLPTPSTCPCTQCPPSRSPTLSARSRLTASPTDLLPNVVRGSDVATTFTAKRESSVRSTVRHAPSTAMLSPMARSVHGEEIVIATPPSRDSSASILPTASISPVNISGLHHQQCVIAQLAAIHRVPSLGSLQWLGTHIGPRRATCTKPYRCLELVDPVHQPLREHRSCQATATLHQHRVDTQGAKAVERILDGGGRQQGQPGAGRQLGWGAGIVDHDHRNAGKVAEDPVLVAHPATAVEHHLGGRCSRGHAAADREAGVIADRSLGADGNGRISGSLTMHPLARGITRYPLRASGVVGDVAVECHCELDGHEGTTVHREATDEAEVLASHFVGRDAIDHLEARCAQLVEATGGIGVWIAETNDDPYHARRDDEIGAWWLLAVMGARLERCHQRGTVCGASRGGDCGSLSVGSAELLVRSL